MLDVMARQGGQMSSLFTAIFDATRSAHLPISGRGRVAADDVALLVSLPPWRFCARSCAYVRGDGQEPHPTALLCLRGRPRINEFIPAQQVCSPRATASQDL
jgi:hypothetical protein